MTTELDPPSTPMTRAVEAIRELLEQNPDHVRVGELDPQEIARAALAETSFGYVASDRPVEVELTLADEHGLSANQTISLPRDMATPEVLGTAVGNAVVGALASYYCGSDAAELGDAVQAVRTVLS